MRFMDILSGFLGRAGKSARAFAKNGGQTGAESSRCPWEREALLSARAGRSIRRIFPLFILFGFLLGTVSPIFAGTEFCSDYKKNPEDTIAIIDGNDPQVRANFPSSAFTIDMNCEFRNFLISPAWPRGLEPTLNFQTPDKSTIYLIVFDRVVYTGNLACASIKHKLWVVNSPPVMDGIVNKLYAQKCQDLRVPVETVDKQIPAPAAGIGDPFTYTLTIPTMNLGGGPSESKLHSVVIWDDLNATGVDLKFVSINAYWKDSGSSVTLVPENDPNSKCGVWTEKNLCYKPYPFIDPGDQIVVEIKVVLNDNETVNVYGTQFINPVRWWYGKVIDLNDNNVIDDGEFFAPLAGEDGISLPMEIAAPDLVVKKTGNETALNLAGEVTFTIDAQNDGGANAYNVKIIDKLPDSPVAGLCDYDPRTNLTAKILAADGSLERELTLGTHYSADYTFAPACELSLSLNPSAGSIAPDQHLVITFKTRLDLDTTQDEVMLTNIAGATQWSSASGSYPYPYHTYDRDITDGTPDDEDHEDSYILYTALADYYFQKIVQNMTSHAGPEMNLTAAPGDILRYRLRIFNVNQTIEDVRITDQLNPAFFDLNTFKMITPQSYFDDREAEYSYGQPSNPDGLLVITGKSEVDKLNIPGGTDFTIDFEITLRSDLEDGTEVLNQAFFSTSSTLSAHSDDPFINGVAPPHVTPDETKVVIETPGNLLKENTKASATIGEQFKYRITVPAEKTSVPLYDVKILDDLSKSGADLRFVSAEVVSGGTYNLSNTNPDPETRDFELVIEDSVRGIDILVDGQLVIEIIVELLNTPNNQSGITFANSATYTYNRARGNDLTETEGAGNTTDEMIVTEPAASLTTSSKAARYVSPAGNQITDPAKGGDILEYIITVHNSGTSTAFDVNIVDLLPSTVELVSGFVTAKRNNVNVPGFDPEPTILPDGSLVWGRENFDGSLDIPAGETLVFTYQVKVLSVGQSITNSAYVDWTSLDGEHPIYPYPGQERTGEGCPTVDPINDYCLALPPVTITTIDTNRIDKVVVSDTYAEDPISVPPAVRVGDTVTYRLTVKLREGLTESLVVQDVLPAGMQLLATPTITTSAGANFSYTSPASPGVGATTLTWDFGDITNNSGTTNMDGSDLLDEIRIEYTALVVTTAPPTGVAHQANITGQNTAWFSYEGGDPASTDPVIHERLNTDQTVDIRQPVISAINKSGTVLGPAAPGDGSQATPYVVDIVENSMRFELQACNTGSAPAYGLVITDQLASPLNGMNISSLSVSITGFAGTPDYIYTAPTSRPGEMNFEFTTPVDPGACVNISYNVPFHTDIPPNQTWFNEAAIGQYLSLPPPAGAREYVAITPVPTSRVWMTNTFIPVLPTKTLFSPATGEATIGQEVIYEITVPGDPVNAALNSVTITDTLDARLEYLSAELISGPAFINNSVAPSQVSFSIPQIPAGQRAVIRVTARVVNSAASQDGDIVNNTVSYQYVEGGVTIPSGASEPATLTIVEPLVAVTKAVSPLTSPNAGDILNYSLTLTASGGAAGDGFADAFDVSIVDTLSLGLAYVAGSATVAGISINPVDTGDGITTPQVLTWSAAALNLDITEGTAVAVSYQVRVLNTVGPNQILRNDVRVEWTSLDGPSSFERTGSGAPAYNDYFSTAFTTLTTPAPAAPLKTALQPTATIGEHFTYRISVPEVPHTTALYDVRIQDNLAAAGADLKFISLNKVSGPGTPVNIGTDTNIIIANSDGTGIDIPAGQQLIIELTVELLNTTANQAIPPKSFTNAVSYTYNQVNNDDGTEQPGGTSPVVSMLVVEPALAMAKAVANVTMGKTAGDPAAVGDTLQYTLTITNSGGSMAHDVNVVDTLPPGLAITGAATAQIDGTPVPGFNPTPTPVAPSTFIWGRENGDNTLDIPGNGGVLVLTYRVTVQKVTDYTITNSAFVDWTSLDGVYPTTPFPGRERTGAGCPTVTAPNSYCYGPATVIINTLDNNSISKAITSDTWAPVDDAVVRVGDLITYQLTLTLREGTTRNVSITDALGAGLAFVEVVGISAGANFITYGPVTSPAPGSTGTLTWTLGNITNAIDDDPTNDFLVITYRARVQHGPAEAPAVTPTIATLNNQATLRYTYADGVTPVPLDPARMQDVAGVEVRQPAITAISKSGTVQGPPALGDGSQGTPFVVDIVNNSMSFSLEACNSGDAPAYGVIIADQLATQLNEASLSTPVVRIGAATLNAGSDYLYTPPAARGGELRVQLNVPLEPSACVNIAYGIGFHIDTGANQFWHNSAMLREYWSLPPGAAREYVAISPVVPSEVWMTNTADIIPPSKAIILPTSGEITIGQEVTYEIRVPGDVSNAALYDVVITDILNANLEYISASRISGPVFSDNSVPPGQVNLTIAQISAGQQAVIELRARVRNVAGAQEGVTISNVVSFTYANTPGGMIQPQVSSPPVSIKIIEPKVTAIKSVSPATPPQAGDLLTYSLEFTADGGVAGDNLADAFDLSIIDSLSLGLGYLAGSATVSGAGNTIGNPAITGDGVTTPYTLTWGLALGNANIDIAEGATITVTYQVRVLNSVLPGQTLSNSVRAEWTGIDGPSGFERTGSGTPAHNDYFTTAAAPSLVIIDNNGITKTRISDTFDPADANVRIGDIVTYELRLSVQEGTLGNVVLTDTLPRGLEYRGIVSINGDVTSPYGAVAPFSHANILAGNVTVAGNPATGPSTVTWNLGDLTNVPNDGANDDFVIVYRARVMNLVLPQTNLNIPLTNSVQMGYDSGTGRQTRTDQETITVLQPRLAVTKSSDPVTGSFIAANQTVTYTVEIANSGTAPAYDAVLEDIIPVGMRNGAATITVQSMELLSGAVLTNLAPAYNAATGIATWNLGINPADRYTIPPGDTLRIIYRVQADSDIPAGLTLTNQAQVKVYYSFDDGAVPADGVTGVREIYAPTNIAATTLHTAMPGALSKATPTQTNVAIGELFTYTVTIPEVQISTALHDVRIMDNLAATGVDLRFVSARIKDGVPLVNSGTNTDITLGGIDIPANDQVVVEITVEVLDTERNLTRVTPFVNTAWYTFSNGTQRLGSLPTTGGTSGPMTIVHPNLVVTKSGPDSMRVGLPDNFILEVQNTGLASAWNLTLTDRLPNPTPGGMCNTQPVVVSAVIHKADSSTVNLAPADYTVNSSDGEPACEFRVNMVTSQTVLAPTERLVLTLQVALDVDSVHLSRLTNIAGATQWFSADSTHEQRHTYTRVLTDGTPAIVDHQDAHEVQVEAANLLFRKTVTNITGDSPTSGASAIPGDRLRYTLTIENLTDVPLANFWMQDELDGLNEVPMFLPGTLRIESAPPGADLSRISSNGGANGTGFVDVRNLSIGPRETLAIVFDVDLAPVITSGTKVLNQGRLIYEGTVFRISDDPALAGTEDPTETLITSAPVFQVLKTSTIMTGDPEALMAGETLRYTITIRNIGNEDAVDVRLRDYTPANTTYLAGSTTLNGSPVTDPSAGVSPLHAGMLVNAPEDVTPGHLRADASMGAATVATVTFDVVVDLNVMNGLVIENQGFVTSIGQGGGVQPEQPSDDPDTDVPDDPTRNVVGNLPLLGAIKTVAIHDDQFGTRGIVDPGDVLRYTIIINNFGPIPATGVVLTDQIPAGTTYVANSLTVNDAPLSADGGVSPLAAGLPVQSGDLPGPGIISAGRSVKVTFDVVVNANAQPGTIISNQGSVTSNELPPEPTDADGLPANGHQPTIIVVGDVQLLSITNEVRVVGGGPAIAGAELEYVIRVRNIGSLPAINVVIADELGQLLGEQVTYVPGSGTLNGSPAGVSYTGSLFMADFASTYGELQPGQTAVIRFRVQVNPDLAAGTTITNTALVNWDDPTQSASAEASLDVGGTLGSGALNGNVWHDLLLNRSHDADEPYLEGWIVELYFRNQLVTTMTTEADGAYSFTGLLPNDGTTDYYELRFQAPGAGPETISLGHADSPFTNGPQRISGITVASLANLQNLNLPLSPNGVVYDSVQRTPLAGVRLTMLNAETNSPLPGQCFDDPAQQNQVTTGDGFYKFDINFSDAACRPGGNYLIEITPPATGYRAAPSMIISPTSDGTTDPFSVPACLGGEGDALPDTSEYCEAVASPVPPPQSVAPGNQGTAYHLHLTLGNNLIPGESQLFNNHIPVDPELDGVVTITKTTPLINVTKGQLVPYTIMVSNELGVPLYDLTIIDRFPAGFKYVEGSARLNGNPREPRLDGLQLLWDDIDLLTDDQHVLNLLLVVGAGVSEGKYVNRAQVINATGGNVSGEATATVRVVPDPTFDCTDVIGKVYDDRNLDGQQDADEKGLPGVRVVTARGLIATTDEHGRFHITCAVVPDSDRGSNFILKLDDRSLPTGFRLTTENPLVQRATRGKMLKYNFGATIHRVVGLDIAEGMFEPDKTDLRLQWEPRIGQLLAELKKGPAVLRLSYLADIEREGLVRSRLEALKNEIARQWEESGGKYRLTIETEVFWRRGAPLKKGSSPNRK